MAGYLVEDQRKVTTHRLIQMKAEGKKIAMLTSYDYTTASITDAAGMDVMSLVRRTRSITSLLAIQPAT